MQLYKCNIKDNKEVYNNGKGISNACKIVKEAKEWSRKVKKEI